MILNSKGIYYNGQPEFDEVLARIATYLNQL
jgi:hypothetical protein